VRPNGVEAFNKPLYGSVASIIYIVGAVLSIKISLTID
jgi:hypothetical protein